MTTPREDAGKPPTPWTTIDKVSREWGLYDVVSRALLGKFSPSRRQLLVGNIVMAVAKWRENFRDCGCWKTDDGYALCPWHERMLQSQVAPLRAALAAAPETPREDAIAALPGHPSPDRGSGPWVLRLVCCGYDDGIERYATWDEADTFRQAYVTGPGGHDRAAILTRDLDTTYHRRRVARRRAAPAAREDPRPAGPWTGDPADYDGDEGR